VLWSCALIIQIEALEQEDAKNLYWIK
jgi:hypothetical protein